MEVIMYKRIGSLGHETQKGNPTLKSSGGHLFEVGLVSAFIWKKLDGHTPLSTISKEIAEIRGVEKSMISSIVTHIISELVRVNLVKEVEVINEIQS
jgi:hypothetical protein